MGHPLQRVARTRHYFKERRPNVQLCLIWIGVAIVIIATDVFSGQEDHSRKPPSGPKHGPLVVAHSAEFEQ